MTLKEQRAEKMNALVALKERIEAEDADAIKEAEDLGVAIAEIDKSIEAAENAKALLEAVGNDETESEEDEMQENGLKSMNLEALKGARGSASTYIKGVNDPDVIKTTQINDYSQNVPVAVPKLGVRDLFGSEKISGNALTYYILGAIKGAIDGTTSEGDEKDKIEVTYTPKTAALVKYGAYFKETDELLSDASFLESAIRNRGTFEFNKAIEAYLVNTLVGTSGVQACGAAITFDNILAAKQDIMADTGYQADAIIINPADWATLLQTKDLNNQYLLGGPAYGSYGNGAYNSNPRVWGLDVVESAAMESGKCIVGAFKAGASVVTKNNEGLRVEISNSDQDDFVKNRVTVRIEERLVEAVRVPAAFSIVGAEESGS